MIRPWPILAALVAILLAAGGGYWKGHHDATTAAKARLVAAKTDALQRAAKADSELAKIKEKSNALPDRPKCGLSAGRRELLPTR